MGGEILIFSFSKKISIADTFRTSFMNTCTPFLMTLMLVSQWQASNSLSCSFSPGRCRDEPKAEDCTSGQLTLGICQDCKECAKAEGEECGGLWKQEGRCADGMICYEEDENNFISGVSVSVPSVGV